MQASHVSRFGPFLNRGLLHSKTLTNRHQCRHTFRIHAARLLQTNPVFHSGFQSCLGFWAAPGRQHHISKEERTAPSKLSASSDAHTHTLTTRTITNANTTLWTAGRSSLPNTLHSDFLALQEDTHGWTARTGKCALMVPVERLASTHQTFVKQTFWEMTEQRFAPERRPGGVCARGPTLFVQSCGSSQQHDQGASASCHDEEREESGCSTLVCDGCDQEEQLMAAVGRAFCEPAVNNVGRLKLEPAQLEEAGWIDTVNSMVLVHKKVTHAGGQALASTISCSPSKATFVRCVEGIEHVPTNSPFVQGRSKGTSSLIVGNPLDKSLQQLLAVPLTQQKSGRRRTRERRTKTNGTDETGLQHNFSKRKHSFFSKTYELSFDD